ncbi:MAG: ABC transporter ATP-binding protein [Candidatus Caldatribacterium sp.]|nr:ABC transporter ATP-binding protein [Candidatus Caldatribacterium sp.]
MLALSVRGLTKCFGEVVANDHIDFGVAEGEIHGLLGENGAGKSVLSSCIYGLYRPDEGKIFLRGKEVHIASPLDAIRLGIGMVHQHLTLVPHLSVWENIVLGREPRRGLWINREEAFREIERLLTETGFQVELTERVENLPVGVRQRVEILKILFRGADILILDEPTAVLTPQEVDQLIATLRRLKAQGKTIVFISHKLKEIFALCDRVTVLRRGRKVGTLPIQEATFETLAEMMVGRRVFLEFPKEEVEKGEVLLSLQGVSTDPPGVPLRDISLEVRSGEILGIAGVEGNGQSELAEVIVGLRKPKRGVVLYRGRDITRALPKERILSGIAHIPEDRHRLGVILDFSIWENLILGFETEPPFRRGWMTLDLSAIREFARRKIREFDIVALNEDVPLRALSGGNQQKVVVARELAFEPMILVACQPTRGLDVAATEYLRNILLAARRRGKAVLLISADLDEVRALSDRVLVMYEGRIVGELAPESDEYRFGLLMGGRTLHEA